MRTFIKNTLLIFMVTVILLEFVGIFIGTNRYFWDDRQLFISKGAHRPLGDRGIWTYSPNKEIVYAATYQLFPVEAWIEYRCKFKTNKFGLIETNFVETDNQVDYLVLGDSYLEGHGGCPWLTRASLPDTYPIILNGGLQGSGIQHFSLLEEWLSQQVEIRNVIVLAISNDFKRSLSPDIWRGRETCLQAGKCQANLDYWWGIDASISDRELLQLSRTRYESRNLTRGEEIEHTLMYCSFSYDAIFRLASIFRRLSNDENHSAIQKQDFNENFHALLRLRQKYPNLKVILVPQRDEVGWFGVENSDTKLVKRFLAENDVKFTLCHIDLSDYMPIDGHPNSTGYGKIFDCLSAVIDQERHKQQSQSSVQTSLLSAPQAPRWRWSATRLSREKGTEMARV
jgi:hypothetical protein